MNNWIIENDRVSYVTGTDGKLFKVCIDGTLYRQCAMCGRFYLIDGNNTKYCGHCRSKGYSIKALATRQNRTTV